MSEANHNGVYSVLSYGAIGDGVSSDTKALQAAMDDCAAAGGGTVVVPPGVYLTGTLWLRSRVNLHLQAGSRLLGASSREEYNADDAFPENPVFSRENVTGAHLVIGYRITDASISGHGCIDGNSSAFFEPLPEGRVASYRYKNANYPIRDWRPGQMVYFSCCERVSVTGVSLLNATYWTLLFLGCDHVQARNLTITNPAATQNGDGIDIDCSSNVTVSDCIIYSGDDSITLRGNPKLLSEKKACENVTVSNCVLASPCNAIRVGVGDGVIRNCVFSGIVIAEGRTGINMVCRYSKFAAHGTHIESVHFANMMMSVMMPLQMIAGDGATSPGGMENISFRGIRIQATAGAYMGGTVETPLRNVVLEDWDVSLEQGSDNTEFHASVPYPYRIHGFPGAEGLPSLPAAVYGTHIEGLSVRGLRLHWGDSLGAVWRDGLMFEHVKQLRLEGSCLGTPQAEGGGAAVRLRGVQGVFVSGCQAAAATGTFLCAEETPEGAPICLGGNELLAAAQPWVSDVPVHEAGNFTA